jgi:hypothetical protein
MEFILSVLVTFVLIGWLIKKIFPFLLVWFVKRRMNKGGGAQFMHFGPFGFASQEQEDFHRKEEEGKVTVVTMDKKEKVIEKDMGEYIDFEEEK